MTLKSIFITVFPGFSGVALFFSIVEYFNYGFSLQILGSFIAAITISTTFSLAFISSKAQKTALADSRNNSNLVPLSIAVIIGALIAIGGYAIEEEKQNLMLGFALVNCINWVLYLTWYSRFKNRNNNQFLKVGNQLPLFHLEDSRRTSIPSNTFIGAPAIFIFYRGNWCPLCMAQIKEIAGQYQELEKRGVKTVLISPQPHDNTKGLSKKFNVGFHFLVDRNNVVAQQLNIIDKGGLPFGFQTLGYESDMVMPTVIITDKKGKIVFVDLTDNYRVRPEPETFLKVIDTLS